jgi:hypothetical protein
MTTRFRLKFNSALVLISLALGLLQPPHPAEASPFLDDCLGAIRHALQRELGVPEVPALAISSRDDLLAWVRLKKVPAYMKRTLAGTDIPVVLVNTETAPVLKNFIDNSIGTQIALQPAYNNDHGLFRFTNRLIDLDKPGARGYGELHATGISWKPLYEYLKRRNSSSSVVIEVSYAINADEKIIAEYYQRVRRAAIFRTQFTFAGTVAQKGVPNLLQTGGEHCFVFCKGTAIHAQISELENLIKNAGIADVQEFLKYPQTQAFLANAQEKILAANADDPRSLNHAIATKETDLKLIAEVLPAGLPPAERQVFANWVIALDASQSYGKLLSDLGVSGDLAVGDSRNPRATAILVYDMPNKAASFFNATYSTPGKFYSMSPADQHPIPAVAEPVAPIVDPR